MKDQYVERQLKKDVEEITPDVIDNAIEKCSSIRQSEKTTKRKPRVWQMCAAAAAVLVLIIGGAFFINNLNAVDSVIGLDVNPSLEISINKNEKVLSVTAVNEDAKDILDGMDLAGTDLKVTVNALIGSMYTNGYISENQNSVLVSVKSGSQERSELLKQELLGYIESALQNKQVEGAVVSLNVESSDTLDQLAQSLGVSQGKATLIEAILAVDPSQNAQELAKLSINDLNLIIDSKNISGIQVTGSASTGQYIGFENARKLVEDKLPGCTIVEFEMDWENGRMVYEGEAFLDGIEYDFEVDALTGGFVKWEQDGYGDTIINPDEEYLTWAEAQANILGKLPDGAVISNLKLDYDDGRAVYEADAYAGFAVYDVEIDAITGETVKWETKTQSGSQGGTDIMTEAKARETVLGKLPSGAVITEIKLDSDNGIKVYEIEAYAGSTEYDIEINAVTGATIKWETKTQSGSQGGTDIMTEAKAKETVLGKLPSGAVITEIKLDSDNGIRVYEIEAYAGSTEYDIEINAVTGATVKWEEENHSGQTGSQNISADKAREIILAKFPGGQIIEFESDIDDGKYEGKIIYNSTLYEFEISVSSGDIIKLENKGGAQQIQISREQAVSIINGKLPGSTIIELELDEENGRPEYDGEAVLNGIEYEFTIDAVTGTITKWEADN